MGSRLRYRHRIRGTSAVILAVIAVVAGGAPASGQGEDGGLPAVSTPPTEVGPEDLMADLAKIEQQWSAIYRCLEDPEVFSTRRLKVSWWSVGQHAGHLALSLDRIGREIEDMLAHPDKNAEQPAGQIAVSLLDAGEIPRGRGRAPDFLRVPVNVTPDGVRRELDAARDRWRGLSARADAIAATPAKFPHFALGPLTSAQWTRFMAVHTAHHLRIVEDILKAPAPAQP